MSTFLGGIYVAYKKSRSVGVTTTAAAVCNLVTDLAAIKYIGLFAASGSTLISYIFLFVFRLIDVQKIVKVKYDLKQMIGILLIILTESVFCFLRRRILNIVNLILGIVFFFVLNKDFVKAVLNKASSMIRKKTA